MPALHDIVTKGSVDRSVVVHIMDSGDGTPETGVVFNTSGIDLWYRREGAAKTSITEATLAALTTAHTDGGFLHISDGDYRLDLPDAAFATAANYVDFGGTVTGMIVVGGRVRLVDYSLEDSVRMGLTGLANAAPGAAGGLQIAGSNAATTYASLTCTGALTVSDGIAVTCSTSNRTAIAATGNGTGNGATITSGNGATGTGLAVVAASTNGAAVTLAGVGTGNGLTSTGGATGHGISGVGGATSGDGLRAAAATSGKGINAIGAGTTQPGILATGGATTSAGISAIGGATSGDAILTAATSGHGIVAAGTGTTKHGIHATGGSTTSHGINALGGGVGHGILATSGGGATGDGIRATAASTNGNGLNLIGVGTGSGELATGGATGHGVSYVGGATSGNGIRAAGTAGNSVAINAIGQGSAAGVLATGGATGHGISAVGGATSGSGISAAAATSGTGITATGVGTTQAGIVATGGSTSSNGITATGGGTGHGIAATSGAGATGNGITATAASTNGSGMTLVKTGTGSDLNATVTPLTLAKTTNITGFNDLSAAQVNAEVDTAISDAGLTAAGISDAVWDEILSGHVVSGSTGEALGAAGGAGDPWITSLPGSYTGTQAGKILADILVDTGTTLQGELDGIQADTEDLQSRLPASLVSGRIDASVGAMASNVMTAAAAAADLTTELQSGLATASALSTVSGLVDDLETRLSATRAGYLDNLSAGAVATAAALVTVSGKVDTVDDLLDTELPALTTAVADLPTNAELATALGTADDAVLAQIALVKAVTDKLDDTLEDDGGTYRFTANALEQAPTGATAPTAAAIADAVWDEALAGHAISGSTGEALAAAGGAGDPWITPLPGVYSAGQAGYILGTNLNATVSSRASQTSVDDVPTNAELATALASADDAVLAAIAALNNLSQANIRTAIGLASANLDTQLDALPTNAELATALASADDAVLAAIAALNNLSSAQAQTAAAAALTAYDPPTRAEATSDANSILTAVADVPTNAELATALADADDAVLAAIAGLNNVSVSGILNATIEGATTLVQSIRLANAALGGKASGLDTTEATYRDLADTKDRIVATVDADGNRTTVTRDLS